MEQPAGARTMRDYYFLLMPVLIGIGVVLLGRAFAIYPLSLIFARSSLRLTARHRHILVWGGLRGALALALSLRLYATPQSFCNPTKSPLNWSRSQLPIPST